MKTVVFVCNWCYPLSTDFQEINGVNAIRVMCSGRIHPGFIFKAFELGADGVLAFGCPKGECRYGTGNEQAEKNFNKARDILKLLGINPERARLEFIPPLESWKIKEIITSFLETLKNEPFTRNS